MKVKAYYIYRMKKVLRLSFPILIAACIIFLPACKGKKNASKSSSSSVSQSKGKSKESDNPNVEKVIKEAESYIGTKYKYGGTTKRGIDCSGLMCASFQSVGETLPRISKDQSKVGKRVFIGELLPGDMIFFGAKPGSKKITHVGLISYVSDKSIKFIHASTSRGVIESEFLSDYYKPRYIKAVRLLK